MNIYLRGESATQHFYENLEDLRFKEQNININRSQTPFKLDF